MKVFGMTGTSQIATVYMADMGRGRLIEFVEALQPPHPREERWILMISTLFGCPVKCRICDAGGQYLGKPNAGEILSQIDYMVDKWYPDRRVPAQKFKIQFARMGEPAFNMAVLDVLEVLPTRYAAPGLMPSLSTIAPKSADAFFERLVDIKNRLYSNGRFQFQFSIHTTDIGLRDWLVPVQKWDLAHMAAYGERFFRPGDRKLTLNFALADGMPVDAGVLLRYFDPGRYLIKITPVNPTFQAQRNGLASYLDSQKQGQHTEIANDLAKHGYEVIVSIGEIEENQIGSNCGQYVLNYLKTGTRIQNGYTYQLQGHAPKEVIA